MPLVALCLRHFLADSIICMCVIDFRQAHERLELSIYFGRLSIMESVEHKKERLEPLFFCCYGQGRHSPSSPIYFPDAAS
jgi:hypothetical protein